MTLEFRGRPPSSPNEPLLFLVHGRAGNMDVMWTFVRAVPQEWEIVAPQAPLPDPLGGYSWWHVDSPDRQQEIEHAAEQLRNFILSYDDPNTPRVRVAAGFSQGAGLLSLLIQRDPRLFTGVALLAGFVLKEASQSAASSGQRARIFMGHGSLDQTIPIQSALEGAERLRAHGFDLEFHQDPVGHKVGSATMRALKGFLLSLSAT